MNLNKESEKATLLSLVNDFCGGGELVELSEESKALLQSYPSIECLEKLRDRIEFFSKLTNKRVASVVRKREIDDLLTKEEKQTWKPEWLESMTKWLKQISISLISDQELKKLRSKFKDMPTTSTTSEKKVEEKLEEKLEEGLEEKLEEKLEEDEEYDYSCSGSDESSVDGGIPDDYGMNSSDDEKRKSSSVRSDFQDEELLKTSCFHFCLTLAPDIQLVFREYDHDDMGIPHREYVLMVEGKEETKRYLFKGTDGLCLLREKFGITIPHNLWVEKFTDLVDVFGGCIPWGEFFYPTEIAGVQNVLFVGKNCLHPAFSTICKLTKQDFEDNKHSGVWLETTFGKLIASEGTRDDVDRRLSEKITLQILTDCAKDLRPLRFLSLLGENLPNMSNYKTRWNFCNFSVEMVICESYCRMRLYKNGELLYKEKITKDGSVIDENGWAEEDKQLNSQVVDSEEVIAFGKWLLLTGEEVLRCVSCPFSPLTAEQLEEKLSVYKFIKLLRGIETVVGEVIPKVVANVVVNYCYSPNCCPSGYFMQLMESVKSDYDE